jgi:curved DNA-binding protein
MNPRTKEFKDYYKILEVPEKATDVEIKKAYRKLALENHPDHHPDDPQCEDRFKEITEAYGVLIDPVKRREYNLFRAATLFGNGQSSGQFNYSQQDIFENMFRQGFSQDIFEELNREFSKSGVRSGNPFFQSMLFGGALGGLTRILGMIPGPIGKIGHGIRIAQMVGSSFMAYNQMRQAQKNTSPEGKITNDPSHDILGSIKGVLKKGVQTITASETNPLDIHLSLTLPALEAMNGTRKKISYKAGNKAEQLVVRIPPNFPTEGKLRIPAKGNAKNAQRGDLILTIKIQVPKNS